MLCRMYQSIRGPKQGQKHKPKSADFCCGPTRNTKNEKHKRKVRRVLQVVAMVCTLRTTGKSGVLRYKTEDRPKRRSGTPPSHSNTTRSIPKILLSAARLDFQWRSWARSRFGCKFLFKILDLSKSCGIAFEDLVGLLATDLTVGGDI